MLLSFRSDSSEVLRRSGSNTSTIFVKMDLKKKATDANMLFVRLLHHTIVILLLSSRSARAQLTINANTPAPSTDGSANTVIGTAGDTIASALLATGTPGIMWGFVPSYTVNEACQQIIDSGSYSLSAHVTHNWGDGDYDLDFTVAATGGCLAASDGSGTEMVLVDQNDRKCAIVCQNDAGTNGCSVWVTGDDVDLIYNNGNNRRLLSIGDGGTKLSGCAGGGVVGGIAGGVVGTGGGLVACFALYPSVVGPELCVGSVILVSVIIGAIEGCDVGSGCFPGDALVQIPGGIRVPMENLAVGDKVAVWKENENVIVYKDIYAFGHKSATAKAVFVRLTLEPYAVTTLEFNSSHSPTGVKELELTALHFVPVRRDNQGKSYVVYTRAQDIQIGDHVWAADSHSSTTGDELVAFVVKDISVTFKTGLYNPLTTSGTIMVNGVVASVHSEWFLDAIFDTLDLSAMLPAAYQLILSPARMLYRIVGKQQYAALYGWLDNIVNVSEFGTHHGGKAFGFISMGVMFSLLVMPWRMLIVSNGTKSTTK